MAEVSPDLAVLVPVLERAQQLGFLGPEPVENHVVHLERFRIEATALAAGDRALDLGSGGGIPGLALALVNPQAQWALLDAMNKRCNFLRWAVDELGLVNAIVMEGRAEELGRMNEFRSEFALVCVRSFGAPAVVAECAAPFLRVGGKLVVSEPPEHRERWPRDGLRQVGLEQIDGGDGVAVMTQVSLCPEDYPRRTGVPAKRPLF